MKDSIIIFKGIKFYNSNFNTLLKILNKGGYLVAPAASALANIEINKSYYNSLLKSDLAILDSGFFCILLRIFKNKKITKFSGYLFLKKFLNNQGIKNKKILLVDPSILDRKLNLSYLKKKKIKNVTSYIAPNYKIRVIDQNLIKLVNKIKPRYIIINIGGEVQELLALYLKNNVKHKISIMCTGAAIAFLTKSQAPINNFIDKYYLGWILRIIYSPRKHIYRMLQSLRLIKFFI